MTFILLPCFLILLSQTNLFLILFMIFFMFFFMILNLNNLNLFYMNNFIFMDEISYLMTLLSLWIVFLMFLTSNQSKMKMFMFMTLLLNLILSFLMSNMLMFYIFFEITLIPMSLIIFLWGGQMERFQAGIYMFTYTICGSLPLLFSIMYMNMYNNMNMYFMYFLNLEFNKIMIIALLMAFLIKLPMYSFHLWLPKAHVEAPVTGSMILAGVMLKLGGYGIYRILYFLNWKNIIFLEKLLFSFSLFGALMISFICLMQIDLKIMIAYSSVCHMSLTIGSIISGNFWGENGYILMLLSHGLCSSGLFCMANMYYERFFTRNMLLLKGMIQMFPFMSMFWFILCIFNMSAPPSMNLLSEIFILGSMMKYSILSSPFLIFISFCSGFYSIILFMFIQHGKFSFLSSVFNFKINEMMLNILHIFPLIIYVFNINIFLSN
uniref:NADH dehydrogenase subunit 4 n=1 Tax=Echinolaelaps fukienensis TaxID=2902762 RepID=UPI0030E3FDB6